LPPVDFFVGHTKMFVTYYKPLFMKPLLLLGCLLLGGTATHAQFSLLPYAGFEQSRNKVTYGNALSTSEINGNLKAGLRFDYRLKGGHSPFINLGTSPAPVTLRFDKSGTLADNYEAVKGALQFRMEAGYQYSSKPIQFKKKSTPSTRMETVERTATEKKSCGSMSYRSHCGEKKMLSKAAPSNDALNMRLQPSLALAYIPSSTENVKQTADGFEYTAGTWKTALVPAMGFEFAKGRQRLFTLGVFYTRPLGQKEATVSNFTEGKTYITNLEPRSSTWGLTLGIPLSLTKANKVKAVKTTTEKRECTKTNYRRCMRLQ
jgi:hypothetical protein